MANKTFITDDEMNQLVSQGRAKPETGPEFLSDADFEARFKPKTKTKYEIPATPENRQQKIAKLQAEAGVATEEAKKAKSPIGFLKNFGKAVVGTIAAPEVALGRTIAGIAGTNMTADKYTKSIAELGSTNADLVKRIREKEAKGEDATNLKKIYNDNLDLIEQFKGEFSDISTPTQKSNLRVAGELGGTALDALTAGTYGKAKTAGMGAFKLAPKTSTLRAATTAVAPELGKVAEIATKPSGLFTARGAANVAKGTGVGYAYDVTSNAQEGKEGAGLFVPGLGTAVGFSLPFISESIQSVKNRRSVDRIIAKRTEVLKKVESSRSGLRTYISKQQGRGFDPAKDIASTDLLKGAVDNTGTIRTRQEGGAVSVYNDFIRPFESEVSDAIKREGKTLPLNQVQDELLDAVNKSGMKGASRTNAISQVLKEIEGYKLELDPTGTKSVSEIMMPVADIHSAKVDKYANVNYLNEGGRLDKTIAKRLKEIVEKNTTSADVKALNNEMSRHYANIGYLEKLDGTKVEGGRLGKHFARVLGGIVGSHFGPLGAIVGSEVAGGIKGAQMSSAFGGKTGRVLEMSDLMKSTSKANAMEKAVQSSKSSKSAGALKTSQSTTATNVTKPTKIGIDQTIPLKGEKSKGNPLTQSSKSVGSLKTPQSKQTTATKKAPSVIDKSISQNEVWYEKGGRNLMEWENQDLTTQELKNKLRVAEEGKEDPDIIKGIREILAGKESPKNPLVPAADKGMGKGTPVIRYSKKGFENTDTFRGGTWYSTPESKSFDFTTESPGQIGGSIKTETNINIKNPLIIRNAGLEEGSFSVINDGYEDYLPKLQKDLANMLYDSYQDFLNKEGSVLGSGNKKFVESVRSILSANDNAASEIDAVIKSTNTLDSAMDLIISKGLKQKGYDSLILENQHKGEVIDRHIFKFQGSGYTPSKNPLVPKSIKPNMAHLQGVKVEKLGVKPSDIVSVRRFGSSVEGKAKPNDFDHFIIVKDGSMKFSMRGGLPNPIVKTIGKNQFIIMPEDGGQELLDSMLYTGRKDQDRLYSGKTVNITNDFKKLFITNPLTGKKK